LFSLVLISLPDAAVDQAFSTAFQQHPTKPHTPPIAIKEYPPFESWKIPLIFRLVPILALFYHEFTSTSIEIPCIIPN
jgi:hypothetical protein